LNDLRLCSCVPVATAIRLHKTAMKSNMLGLNWANNKSAKITPN